MKIEEAMEGRQGGDQYQVKESPVISLDIPIEEPSYESEVEKVECQNFVTPPQGRSDSIAAKAVGMKRETYRQGSRSVLAPSTVPSGRDKD